MNRCMLVLACLVVCGCASRMNTGLLQARIREQAVQLAETQREVEKTRSELKQSRQEADRLKAERGAGGPAGEATVRSTAQINKLHIYPLASGGLNKDNEPGDDAVVVQFAPFDRDNEPIKIPGQLEFVLLDPQLPQSEQELGRWSFSTDECRSHWTRGIASTGFQFTLPLEQSARHTDLVVKLRMKTANDRRYETSQVVKAIAGSGNATAQNQRAGRKLVQVVDDSDQPLPPVGVPEEESNDEDLAEWAQEDRKNEPKKTGAAILHSSSWTDAPVLR